MKMSQISAGIYRRIAKATLARFSAGGLVQTEELARSLLEAGVEASRGQVHSISQPFDGGATGRLVLLSINTFQNLHEDVAPFSFRNTLL